MAKLVAITGGIGSGKSVVSNILHILGYQVYDCDSQAKELMKKDNQIIYSLKKEFGDTIYKKDKLDNRLLANIVFNDSKKLGILNSIVHPAVKNDILKWSENFAATQIVFFETAILKESNLEDIVDDVIIVEAPIEIRIKRVIKRNNITENEVRERINSQNNQFNFSADTYYINNGYVNPLIPQVKNILKRIAP